MSFIWIYPRLDSPLLAALGRVKENSRVPPITRVCGRRCGLLTGIAGRPLAEDCRQSRCGRYGFNAAVLPGLPSLRIRGGSGALGELRISDSGIARFWSSGCSGGGGATASGRIHVRNRPRVGTHRAGTGALATGVAGQAVLFGAVGAAGLSQRGHVGAVSTEALFLPVLAALGCRLSVAFLSFVGSERGLLGLFPIRWLGGFILSCRGLGFGGTFLALVDFGLDCGLVGIMPVDRHVKVEFKLESVPPCPLVRGNSGFPYRTSPLPWDTAAQAGLLASCSFA